MILLPSPDCFCMVSNTKMVVVVVRWSVHARVVLRPFRTASVDPGVRTTWFGMW